MAANLAQQVHTFVPYTRDKYSTNYDARYDINNFMDTVEVEYENGFVEVYPDFLNHKLSSLLDKIQDWTPYVYNGAEHLTTICYKMYGNTTVIWLIMMYNGIMHPLEVAPGTMLMMPDRQQVDTYLKDVKSNIGKVVEI